MSCEYKKITKAFDQKERNDMKAIIESRVSRLFLYIHRYHMAKKKYTHAISNREISNKHRERLRKEVTDSLYLQIKAKRKFKNILQ